MLHGVCDPLKGEPHSCLVSKLNECSEFIVHMGEFIKVDVSLRFDLIIQGP